MAAREVRRVVIYQDDTGWFRWFAQGANWRTVDRATGRVARVSTARRHVEAKFPGVEIVVR